MSFSENLKTLRKMTNMSQEQLAEKLEVSRQAVSKWETGEGYPETEKILTICKMFNCSMDEILQGEITQDTSDIKNKYEALFNSFAKSVAFGVFIIIIGFILLLLFGELVMRNYISEAVGDATGMGILLSLTMIAVAGFIYQGMTKSNFEKKNQTIPQIYSQSEIDTFNKKFIFAIIFGVSLILFGLIFLVVFQELNTFGNNSDIPTMVFLTLVSFGVFLFVYFGIQKSKYNINEYNEENCLEKQNESSITDKIDSVIMLVATAIFLFCGFVFNWWRFAWVAFPIGGIFVAIANVIIGKEE